MRAEGCSEPTALGRILAKGVGLGRIAPCAFCRRRVTAKKRRPFAKGHAQRWTAGAKAAPARAEYQRFYNHVRPHYALDLMTPMEYLLQNRPAESGQSQM